MFACAIDKINSRILTDVHGKGRSKERVSDLTVLIIIFSEQSMAVKEEKNLPCEHDDDAIQILLI